MSGGDSHRFEVADQLTRWSASGGQLHRDAIDCTDSLYSTDVDRLRYHRDVIEEHLARANPSCDARSAIVTAGPPGAGKSTAVRVSVVDLDEYRIIDSDEIKDDLIRKALQDGIYADRLSEILADGHNLAPRELSALVHIESVKLADQIRRICVQRKENILIEGTLTWSGHGPMIFRELADSQYVDIRVYGLDVDAATAHQQALDRWWKGRLAWVSGADPLGGRFTPAEAIDICYPASGESVCTANALQFIDIAQSGEIPNVRVTILHKEPSGALAVSMERFYRQ